MTLEKGDYTGCAVLLYDGNGEYIKRCEVSHFNKRTYQLQLKSGIPPVLTVDDICSLLILTEPSPMEYKGRVLIEKSERVFVLFRGKEKESRRIGRYKVNFTAQITALIRDGEVYDLHTAIEVKVINISRNGIRLRAAVNALRENDKINLKVLIDGIEKQLTAVVVNQTDKGSEASEYGCGLIGG
ncbi:MAG: PilZ domain-containing protein [Defluviitaleaceae bacterium]|nr:PilZ domain-containing protein [Defluviitaleaceae bacterium]